MRRALLFVIVAALFGAALLQEGQGEGASLELSVEPAEAHVNVSGPDGYMSMLAVRGSHTLDGLPAGRYLITATAPGHAADQAEVELGEGDSESVTLTLSSLEDGEADEADAEGEEQDAAEQEDAADAQADDDAADGDDAAQQDEDDAQAQQDEEDDAQAQVEPGQGQQIYEQQCAQCHGQEGEGGTGPALAGNENMQDHEMVIAQIVEGGDGMPAFGDQLSDEEIAAVATHEMTSWGNDFGEVSADQVAEHRDGSEAADDGEEQDGDQGQQDGDDADEDQQEQQEEEPTDEGDQGQEGDADAEADEQQDQQDDVRQGDLQIDWVEPGGATVTVTGPGGYAEEMELVGGTLLEGLEPGTYVVTAAAEGYQSASTEVEVEAQETAAVSLTLERQRAEQQAARQEDDGQAAPDEQQAQQDEQQEQETEGDQDEQQADEDDADQDDGAAADAELGESTYSQQCASCHGQEGEGASAPALAGNEELQDVDYVIDQILEGGGGMPAFGDRLSDDEVAAVATHELTSWGNEFDEVSADQVAERRNGGQQEGDQEQEQQEGDQDQQEEDQEQDDGGQAQEAEGFFTAEQARQGQDEYLSQCAVCHGSGLEGRASYPPLLGDDFLQNWGGRPVSELFDYTSKEMPQDRPGELGHLTYTLITAFMLEQNGFQAGNQRFEPGSARFAELVLPATAPGPDPEQEGETPAKVGEEPEEPTEDDE